MMIHERSVPCMGQSRRRRLSGRGRSMTLRVGVVGTGIGAMHVEIFGRVPGVEVTGVCSAQLTRAQALAGKHNVPFATDDYAALLERVDAVVIATPPGLHAPMGLAA